MIVYSLDYTVSVREGGKVIALIDNDRGTTITNAPEIAIHELSRTHGLAGRRIVYRDTEGWWDELRHDGQRFVGFAPVRAKSLDEALRRIRGELS